MIWAIDFENKGVKMSQQKKKKEKWRLRLTGPYHPLQKQPLEVFHEKGVLKNFSNFTGKHLCRSLFLAKLQAFGWFPVNAHRASLVSASAKLLLRWIWLKWPINILEWRHGRFFIVSIKIIQYRNPVFLLLNFIIN